MGLVHKLYFFACVIFFTTVYSNAVSNEISFDESYQILYGENHITKLDQGSKVQLLIDPSTGGAGFRSKLDYLSGFFQIQMKLPSNSTGIVTTFYLISDRKEGGHQELDFEFLGDQTLQTNVFSDGIGGREQRFRFWFDPTADFHTYAILWNPFTIIFLVDNVPIRVFKNNEQYRIHFGEKPMHIEATLWNADWAGKVDWSHGPFKAEYKGFAIRGCPSSAGPNACAQPGLPWNPFHGIMEPQMATYRQIRKDFMNYDYCSDPKRPPPNPQECVQM